MGCISVGIAFLRSPQPISYPSTKFVITPSPSAQLANIAFNDLGISGDGRHVFYKANTERGVQLYLHSMDDFTGRQIPGTEGTTFGNGFSSPDGESLGFFADGKLKKVSLAGGSPINLCEAAGPLSKAGSWGLDDTIVFSAGSESGTALYKVSAFGGECEILTTPDIDKGEAHYTTPHILPGGKAVLFSIRLSSGNSYQVVVLSLETGEQEILIEDGRQGRYVKTGHLVYGRR